MRDDALDEQVALIDLIESEGWDVTETDLSVYESPWDEEGTPEATLTITARKVLPDDETDDGDGGHGAGGDDSPYRVN